MYNISLQFGLPCKLITKSDIQENLFSSQPRMSKSIFLKTNNIKSKFNLFKRDISIKLIKMAQLTFANSIFCTSMLLNSEICKQITLLRFTSLRKTQMTFKHVKRFVQFTFRPDTNWAAQWNSWLSSKAWQIDYDWFEIQCVNMPIDKRFEIHYLFFEFSNSVMVQYHFSQPIDLVLGGPPTSHIHRQLGWDFYWFRAWKRQPFPQTL